MAKELYPVPKLELCGERPKRLFMLASAGDRISQIGLCITQEL